MSGVKLNVLIIDSDTRTSTFLASILKEKFQVFVANSRETMMSVLCSERINIAFCDYQLSQPNKWGIITYITQTACDIDVIYTSSTGTIDSVIEALRTGVVDFLKKPFTVDEVWFSIERTRYGETIRSGNKSQTKKLNTSSVLELPIIGDQSTMTIIRQQMELVAQTPDTSVLIIGESGTGKELVARGIHNLSKRSNEFFGAVNMSAIPETLFESEFFGHKKGSFTGAIVDKAGWFETGNRGTLFFDEIGEMNSNLQVKLLRVLEDRSFTKVGAQREQLFDIRVISATNKLVSELTEGKAFRLDLFHRLATFVICLPPLRERRNDIPALTNHFLRIHSKKMGKHITAVNKQVYNLFDSYIFPGNIRELRNLVERAVIVCQGKELLPEHFDSIMQTPTFDFSPSHLQTFDLKEIERETIIRALKMVNYNKTEAARLLNLEWNALYRRIQKFNIMLPENSMVL